MIANVLPSLFPRNSWTKRSSLDLVVDSSMPPRFLFLNWAYIFVNCTSCLLLVYFYNSETLFIEQLCMIFPMLLPAHLLRSVSCIEFCPYTTVPDMSWWLGLVFLSRIPWFVVAHCRTFVVFFTIYLYVFPPAKDGIGLRLPWRLGLLSSMAW